MTGYSTREKFISLCLEVVIQQAHQQMSGTPRQAKRVSFTASIAGRGLFDLT